MSQLQSNLSQHWNRYLVVIALIALAILKNRNVLTAEDVINIQYALYTLGIMPSDPRTIIRRSRKVAPLLLLFLLFHCKPKPETRRQQIEQQVKESLTKKNEKVIAVVESMSDAQLDSLLANDPEFRSTFEHFYRNARP